MGAGVKAWFRGTCRRGTDSGGIQEDNRGGDEEGGDGKRGRVYQWRGRGGRLWKEGAGLSVEGDKLCKPSKLVLAA